jgi:hypothetical protein
MDELLMKYFVLKPAGKDQYAAASRAAMRRYAKVIAATNPTLASDLHSWAEREFGKAWEGDDATAERIANETGNEQR